MATITYSWEPGTGGFFVNTGMSGAQNASTAIAINGGTAYMAAWDSFGYIQGRVINSDGTGGTEKSFVPLDAAYDYEPSLAQLTNGNVIMTYTRHETSGAQGDIWGQLLDSSGNVIGSPFVLSDQTVDLRNSQVAALSTGGFAVTYEVDQGGGNFDLFEQVYNADGSSYAGPYTLEPSTTITTSAHDMAALADGKFVVTWQETDSSSGFSATYFEVLSASGAYVVGKTAVDDSGDVNENPKVVALKDGGFAIAFVDNGWNATDRDISLHIYNADGSSRAGDIEVNLINTTGDQVDPAITLLSNGYIAVSWLDGDSQYAQVYDPSGNAIGETRYFASSVVDGELIGLAGGLLASLRDSSYADDGGDASIRSQIEELTRTTTGDSFSETLTGDSLRDTILGAGGDDTLYGLGGNDWLNGGTGADTMVGGYGDDTFIVDNSGDVVTETSSVGGHDTVRSSISYALVGWTEDLILTGTAAINGTGNSRVNFIQGNNGANTLNGGAGADEMRGAGGNDIYIVDNAGDRAIETASASGDDTVKASVSYIIGSGIERLTLTGSAAINGTGNASDNVLTGNNGDNILAGRAGQDSIAGNGGVDRLYGEGGNDILDGGAGGDAVEGGAGQDRLTGGLGADYFVFRDGDFGTTTATADRVTDFSHAEGDRLRLNYADANSSVGGDQAFTFIGTATFTHVAGQLRYEQISGNTYVAGDTNGDGTADFVIRLDGLHTLVSGDFVL